MVVGAVVIAVGAQGAVTSGADRDVLRNHVDPPLDIHDYPSPLQTYRKYIRDDADTALFTVEDLPDGARVRLATVDYYDGVVYGVGASGQSGSGIFQRVGTSIPTETEGNAHSATFTVEALRGVWVPDIGYLTDISYDGARADELSRSTHYNRVTGVAVTTAALSEGDTYDVDFVLPPVPTREDLAGVDLAQLTVPAAQNIPEVAAEFAASESAGADSSSGRVIALAEALAGTGYFSHGLEDQPQSRSGHGSERIAALLTADQMIGDDEQYAVAMAVMARSMGMPARVVMGFYPESGEGGTFTATGDHLHVWVEVAFEDWGWVTFDPAPADDMTPPDEDEPPQREPKPQVLQPPPPPEDPAELPPSAPVEDDALGSQRDWGQSLLAVAVYVLAVGGVLAVLLGPFLVIALSKVRLRRRRKRAARTSDRVAGAWDEVLDRATDAGATLDVTATRPEHAAELEHRFGQVPVLALARQADAGVFGREEPTEEQTAQFWESIEQYLAEVRRADGWWARVRASLSVRSLASRRGVRRGSRQRSTRRDAT
jgi:transglutaminase-like putative cysteine protease